MDTKKIESPGRLLNASAATKFESLLDSDPANLSPEKLSAIIPELSLLMKFEVENRLDMLKSTFALSSDQIRALRSDINQYRKEIGNANFNVAGSVLPGNCSYSMNFEGLIDLVEKNNEPHFLIKKDGELICVKEYVQDGITLIPPPKKSIPFKLLSYENVISWYKAYFAFLDSEINIPLFEEIESRLKQISTLSSESDYMISTLWIIHTYLLEKAHFSPIICFVGAPGRGKSRMGNGMIYLAFRGKMEVSVREAHIIRLADYFTASIFFDSKDLWKNIVRTGSEDIFLLRFEKGAKVERIHSPEKGKYQDTTYYRIFGPTIIATNEDIHNILGTRAIKISPPFDNNTFEEDIVPQSFIQFRERLTAFRAYYLDRDLPKTSKPCRGRLGDICKPLREILLLIKPKLDPQFLAYLDEQIKEKAEDNLDNFAAEILQAIWVKRGSVVNGKLSIKIIAHYYNILKKPREKKNSRSIGWKIRSLGIKGTTMSDGTRGIEFNEDQIKILFIHYGIEEKLINYTEVDYDEERGITRSSIHRGSPGLSGVS